jgi:hypothetical protein
LDRDSSGVETSKKLKARTLNDRAYIALTLAHVQKQNQVGMFTTQKQLKYQVVVLPCLDKMMNQKQ